MGDGKRNLLFVSNFMVKLHQLVKSFLHYILHTICLPNGPEVYLALRPELRMEVVG